MRRKKKIPIKTLNLFKNISNILSPPPKLTVSEWADRYRYLSAESSAEPGKWNTDRAPYQREIMDAVSNSYVETVVIKSSAQIGKALDIETSIPTPDGWKKMKDIQVGDSLFDESGEICKVTFATEIMNNRKCYKVIFSDNTTLIADKDHLWTVEVYKYGKFERVDTMTTLQMLEIYKTGKRNNLAIPVANPLNLKDKDLPINPYVLGTWLGDGNSYSGQITLHEKDIEIVEYIKDYGFDVVIKRDKRNNKVLSAKINPYKKSDICIRGHDINLLGRTKQGYCAECHRQISLKNKWKDGRTVDPIINKQNTFHSKLKETNLIGNKHIPKIYLRASVNQRLELLRGLMDTAGYISNEGRCEFITSCEKLSEGFGELLSSLGIKYTCKIKMALATNGNTDKPTKTWRFSFLVYNDTKIFKLKRKLNRMVSREGRRTTETEKRRVVNITEVESRPVKCITVDSKSHLYLAGKQMIPTHNTELINNIIGYYIDYDPCPMLMVMPTDGLAKTWSKKRLSPMLRDTPNLQGRIKSAKTRDSDNTILEKGFPGGYIAMVGANSPVGLSSRPVRILLADEVDRFPASAGNEGDPLNLAVKRTSTFSNRKKVFVSTPTDKSISRIEKEFNTTTMERWNIPCPVCGKYQELDWERIKFTRIDPQDTEVKDVTMECKFCKERLTEFEWKKEQKNGKWIADKPGKQKRGFHINALASPWERWDSIINQFLESKNDKDTLKTWVNTFLGEAWEDNEGETMEHEVLFKRREAYNAQVPDDVLLLTAGVDVQDDRVEIEVVGWGEDNESWGIEYKKIYGNFETGEIWSRLDEYLSSIFYYNDGTPINIACTCIDTGYLAEEVYKFVKSRELKRIFGIKGIGGFDKATVGKPKKTSREGINLFPLGVDSLKDKVYGRLKIDFMGPGYCHFPTEQIKGYDEDYFKSLCSEKRVTRGNKLVWVKKRKRNEGLDLRNYATAALEILNPNYKALKEMKNRAGNRIVQPVKKRKKRRQISKGIQ